MSRAKPFTISLAVRGPDGRRFTAWWETSPIGSSDTSLASFWMLLKASLELGLHTAKHEVVDSLQKSPLKEPEI